MAATPPLNPEANRARLRGPDRAGGRLAMDRYRLGILLFLIAAGASFLLSIGLWFAGHRDEGVFVGLWVPSILAAGAFWVTAVSPRP
jgi:hypothetical protein